MKWHGHLNGGPCGETTRYRYAGMEKRDAQVGGWYRAEAQQEVSVDREEGKLSIGGKSNNGRVRQGGAGIIAT